MQTASRRGIHRASSQPSPRLSRSDSQLPPRDRTCFCPLPRAPTAGLSPEHRFGMLRQWVCRSGDSSGAPSSKRRAKPQDNTKRGSKLMVTFHSAREAPPVSKHHQRQPLSVEVVDSLRRFKGRVREPHLTSLLDYLLGTKTTVQP